MSEYNTSDVKLDENPGGSVSFATEVIATIAGLAASEIEGVASMSAPASGLADMFGRKQAKNPTKGVHVEVKDDKVTAEISMIVEYGYPVPQVARAIQENVKKAVETMTGLEVAAVDIRVAGISFEKEMAEVNALNEQQKKMLEKLDEKHEEPAKVETVVEEPVADETVEEAVEETAQEETVEEPVEETEEAPEEETSAEE